MSPMDWAVRPLQKYAQFSGRASRAEFWWYMLFVVVAAVVLAIVESALGLQALFLIYGPMTVILVLATFVPSLAVQVRRLHDTNRSGWWLLGMYIPYAIMLALMPSMMTPGEGGIPNLGSAAIAGLLSLIVMVMAIVLLVFYVLRGTSGPNSYGPDPYGADVEQVFA